LAARLWNLHVSCVTSIEDFKTKFYERVMDEAGDEAMVVHGKLTKILNDLKKSAVSAPSAGVSDEDSDDPFSINFDSEAKELPRDPLEWILDNSLAKLRNTTERVDKVRLGGFADPDEFFV